MPALHLELDGTSGLFGPEEWAAERRRAAEAFARLYGRPEEDAENKGWMSVRDAACDLPALTQKAREIREKGETLVVVGVGGSNRAAQAAVRALAPDADILWAGNTLSAAEVRRILDKIETKDVCLDVIAKNFETLEPGSHFRVLRQAMARRWSGRELAERITVTGTRGSRLERVAREQGYAFLTFPDAIGGRYSALSPVGLLPMAAAGLEIDSLLSGAEEMERALRADGTGGAAADYAACRSLAWRKGKRVEILSCFEPRLEGLGRWWLQLFGESEGKDGKGLFPACAVFSEDLHAIGQYIQQGTQQHIETFLCVRDGGASVTLHNDGVDDGFGYLDGMDFAEINRRAEEATMAAHAAGGVPCVRVGVDRIDEAALGRLFYFFMASCAVSARLLGVDPFDQPGVEEYKARMFRALGKDVQ